MNHQAAYIIIKAKRGLVRGILYLMVVGWRSLSPCTSRGRGQERIGLNYVGHCLCSIPLTVAQAKLGTVWGRPQISSLSVAPLVLRKADVFSLIEA